MNRLCRDAGHAWMYVANDTYRVCRREGCTASERLKNGQWVSNLPLYRKYASVFTSNPSLWDNPHKEN